MLFTKIFLNMYNTSKNLKCEYLDWLIDSNAYKLASTKYSQITYYSILIQIYKEVLK